MNTVALTPPSSDDEWANLLSWLLVQPTEFMDIIKEAYKVSQEHSHFKVVVMPKDETPISREEITGFYYGKDKYFSEG